MVAGRREGESPHHLRAPQHAHNAHHPFFLVRWPQPIAFASAPNERATEAANQLKLSNRPFPSSLRAIGLFEGGRLLALGTSATSLASLLRDDSTHAGSRCTRHLPPRDQESPGPNLPPSHVSGFSYPARFVKFQSPPAIFDDLLRRLVRFLLEH